MSTVKIVYLDRGGLPDYIRLRAPAKAHEWINHSGSEPRDVIKRCSNANVVVTNKVAISKEVIEACPSIKHVAISATGYNKIDIEACRKQGVSVSNIQNYANTTVPEHVITLTLMLRREILRYRHQVIDAKWQDSANFCLFDKPFNDLYGSIFGIIGFGTLGQATAKLAHALGMQVVFSSPSRYQSDIATQVSMNQLISGSDIISLHCGLTPQTHNLIGAKELSSMQPHTILINTARGGIVDETAVVDAIKRDAIGAIGFDVLATEPPSNDSPLLAIANRNNVIITPHIAWASDQAMQLLADILIDNIDAFLAGKPQNIVT